MNMQLLLLAALFGFTGFVDGNVHSYRNVATSGSKLIELGATIRNGSSSIIEVAMSKDLGNGSRLLSKYITVDITASNYTMIKFSGGQAPFHAIGCVPTNIVANENQPNVTMDTFKVAILDMLRQSHISWSLVIFTAPIYSVDSQVLANFGRKKVIFGFYQDAGFSSTSSHVDVEMALFNAGIVLIENLVRPTGPEMALSPANSYFAYILAAQYVEPSPALANVVLVEHQLVNHERRLCSANQRLEILSHKYSGELPIYPGYQRPALVKMGRSNVAAVKFLEHYSTHLDMPYHLFPLGVTADALPLDRSLAPCIRVSHNEVDSDVAVPLSAFEKWERDNGQAIPEGSIVIVDTEFHKRWDRPADYTNIQAGSKKPAFPGLSVEAAEFLATERRISVLGIDTLSTDPGSSANLPAHVTLAKQGIIGLENVANVHALDQSSGGPVICLLVYLRSERGTGAPVAVFAHVNPKSDGTKVVVELGTLILVALQLVVSHL